MHLNNYKFIIIIYYYNSTQTRVHITSYTYIIIIETK